MYCSKCKNEIKEGDKFCSKCGTPIKEQPNVENDVTMNKQREEELRVIIKKCLIDKGHEPEYYAISYILGQIEDEEIDTKRTISGEELEHFIKEECCKSLDRMDKIYGKYNNTIEEYLKSIRIWNKKYHSFKCFK